MEMKTAHYLQGIKINYSFCQFQKELYIIGTSFWNSGCYFYEYWNDLMSEPLGVFQKKAVNDS